MLGTVRCVLPSMASLPCFACQNTSGAASCVPAGSRTQLALQTECRALAGRAQLPGVPPVHSGEGCGPACSSSNGAGQPCRAVQQGAAGQAYQPVEAASAGVSSGLRGADRSGHQPLARHPALPGLRPGQLCVRDPEGDERQDGGGHGAAPARHPGLPKAPGDQRVGAPPVCAPERGARAEHTRAALVAHPRAARCRPPRAHKCLAGACQGALRQARRSARRTNQQRCPSSRA